MLVVVEEVRTIARRALINVGVPSEFAELQTDLWLEADLRGIASHGLMRFERIVERIRNGLVDPKAIGKHSWSGEAMLKVDGMNGLGPVVADRALDALTVRARRTGVAAAALSRCQHLGMLAWYTERVARRGQVAIAFSTSEALVHPWGGRRAHIGTNPISIGLPTGESDPFVMDTATSIISMGEIHDRAARGEPLPEGSALDATGRPTTDAAAAKDGAIAPFGAAKGYALGLAFELMVSSLTGSALGKAVKGTLDSEWPSNKGDVFIVFDRPLLSGIATHLETLRRADPAEGFEKVLIPGERSRTVRDAGLSHGLDVADPVWQRIVDLAKQHPIEKKGALQ